ncbi:hypothetical protein L596_021000 [Steinernema carpocapsae]|uniref:Uncharacterized protein n=1 Tax=Steinernema carpocapsae TaxID=34508 RepID=A0A4U5MVU7_STECR|nr:hypothetical protein L596_021000 [Steinernema carpocapsae]
MDGQDFFGLEIVHKLLAHLLRAIGASVGVIGCQPSQIQAVSLLPALDLASGKRFFVAQVLVEVHGRLPVNALWKSFNIFQQNPPSSSENCKGVFNNSASTQWSIIERRVFKTCMTTKRLHYSLIGGTLRLQGKRMGARIRIHEAGLLKERQSDLLKVLCRESCFPGLDYLFCCVRVPVGSDGVIQEVVIGVAKSEQHG